MRIFFFTFTFTLLSVKPLTAQQEFISGQIKDSLSQPIGYATITASLKPDEKQLFAYTTSDKQGKYNLKFITPATDSIYLYFRHVSHQTKAIKVNYKTSYLDVILESKENQLENVIVNAKKELEIKGDTIIYSVDGLKKDKDYTIEEVLERIPGVKINANGQISYNNKAISHFYINGVDLLEGRYNVATRGIPADAVEDIEILQRHNHARIDKGRTDSDDVAFNLNIKKDQNLVFGSAKADAGVPLLTGRAEATPIYLQEKFQNIGSLKINNIGRSLISEGQKLTRGNYNISLLELENLDILQEPNTSGTLISDQYWLDNESFSFTNNSLYKSNKDLILKAAVNYNRNETEINTSLEQTFFFENDNTQVFRQTKNSLNQERFLSQLTQEINKKDFFLKNKITLEQKNDNGISIINQNNSDLLSIYAENNITLKDVLVFKTTLGKQVLNNGFLIEYTNEEEELNVIPSVFNNQIISSFEPESTQQSISANRFNIGGYSSFDFNALGVDWNAKQSLNWRHESLETKLQQQSANENTNLGFPFVSDFNLNTTRSTTSLTSKFDYSGINFSVSPTITILNLEQEEDLQPNLSDSDLYFWFQPKVSATYRITNKWTSSLSFDRRLEASKFNNLHNGLVLSNFSNLYQNPNAVNVTKTNSANAFLGYTDILSGFMFSSNFSVDDVVSDFTFSSQIDEDGLLQTVAIDRPNSTRVLSSSTYFTKSFFNWLKADLVYTFSDRESEQFFNDELQFNSTIAHFTSLEFEIDNNSWYSLFYKGTVNYFESKINDFEATNLYFKHDVEIDFYTSSKTRINFGIESIFTKQSTNTTTNQNSLFNASFYYKPNKRLFLRASLINILDETVFTTARSNANFISRSQFSLRPRQFTIGLNYSL